MCSHTTIDKPVAAKCCSKPAKSIMCALRFERWHKVTEFAICDRQTEHSIQIEIQDPANAILSLIALDKFSYSIIRRWYGVQQKKNRITGFCLKPHNANVRAFVWFASKSTFKYTISTLIQYNIIEPHNKCHFEIIANGNRNRSNKLRIGHTMNH